MQQPASPFRGTHIAAHGVGPTQSSPQSVDLDCHPGSPCSETYPGVVCFTCAALKASAGAALATISQTTHPLDSYITAGNSILTVCTFSVWVRVVLVLVLQLLLVKTCRACAALVPSAAEFLLRFSLP